MRNDQHGLQRLSCLPDGDLHWPLDAKPAAAPAPAAAPDAAAEGSGGGGGEAADGDDGILMMGSYDESPAPSATAGDSGPDSGGVVARELKAPTVLELVEPL